MTNNDNEIQPRHLDYRERLRDPVWQFLSAVVALIALFVSLFSSYDIYSKLKFVKQLEIRTLYSAPIVSITTTTDTKLGLLYDGESIDCASVLGLYFENTGNEAILPNDFISPIEVRVPNSAQVVSIRTDNSKPRNLNPVFTQVDTSKISLEPLLLNPQDGFTAELTILNFCEPGAVPLSITGRVVDVAEIVLILNSPEKNVFDRLHQAYNTEALIIIPLVTLIGFLLLWFWSKPWDWIVFIFGRRPGTRWGRITLNLAIATLAATVAEDIVEGLVQLLK